MKQLIIDGIDWLDPRMVGVKCWFWSENSQPVLKMLSGVDTSKHHKFTYETLSGTAFNIHCRVAQGKKTIYDGGGQPIPDAIWVRVWWFNGDYESIGEPTLSQNIKWDGQLGITHYEIQEMPKKKCTCYKEGFADVCDKCSCEDKKELTDNGSMIITNELRDEIIRLLDDYRYWEGQPKNRFDGVDKILKELRG